MEQITDNSKYLNKENVKPLQFNLDNLVMILEEAYKTLNKVNQSNLILAVGNTGCGKSTMMTSLMFGVDALEETKIEYEIEIPMANAPNRKKKKKKPVIEQTDKIKGMNVFSIGHSDSESKTFLPQTYKKPDDTTNTIYVDIAGQQDTGGDLIEYVNVFVTK